MDKFISIFYNFLDNIIINILLHTSLFFLIQLSIYKSIFFWYVNMQKLIYLPQSCVTSWQWCLAANVRWSVRTGWVNQFQLRIQAAPYFKIMLAVIMHINLCMPLSMYKCACTVVYCPLYSSLLHIRSRGSAQQYSWQQWTRWVLYSHADWITAAMDSNISS